MSTEQVDDSKQSPVEVNDWDGLYQYVNILFLTMNYRRKKCFFLGRGFMSKFGKEYKDIFN